MSLSRQQKKKLLIGSIAVLVLLGIGFAFGMSKRDGYLGQIISKVQYKLKKEYDLNFVVDKYGFDGLNTVVFENVRIIPQGRDTLMNMDKLGVSVRIWPLIFGEVKIADLDLQNGHIAFVKGDSISNYDFLFRKRKQDSVEVEKPTERNFAEWAERLSKEVFAKIPSNMTMNNFEVSYTDSLMTQRIRVPEAYIEDGDFETSLFLNDHDAEWVLQGHVDGDRQQLKLEISSKEKDAKLPFLQGKYGLGVSFDKITFDLKGINRVKKDLLHLDGSVSYDNLSVYHRRLSDSTVLLPHAEANGGIEISSDYIALKDKSTIRVKEFSVSPQIKYTRKPIRTFELAVHTGMFEAQNFFDAIPKGLFENLESVEVTGAVAYNLDFSVDLDKPDDLVFRSSIDDEDLKVLKWGKANIDSLNSAFEYDAYNDTILVRKISVSSSNPNFRTLDKIPYVLKTTVRNTEDPFFYKHNGFEEEAFKLSIVTNIKEKKFKRGASTISMQLVKNVFLNRKKTMNRKFEEILLVWLMESSGKVSKDRLFEIYLNVIEWGKNVYGITEAAKYYFNKDVSEINLGESLYLSSIIPRPKTGLSSFDHTGHLKPWVLQHFNTYGYIMNKVGDLQNVSVPQSYGFYDVVLVPNLRPHAPKVQADDIVEDHEAIIRQLEEEEGSKKTIFDKIFKEVN